MLFNIHIQLGTKYRLSNKYNYKVIRSRKADMGERKVGVAERKIFILGKDLSRKYCTMQTAFNFFMPTTIHISNIMKPILVSQ